jgi:hypothetical protein
MGLRVQREREVSVDLPVVTRARHPAAASGDVDCLVPMSSSRHSNFVRSFRHITLILVRLRTVELKLRDPHMCC